MRDKIINIGSLNGPLCNSEKQTINFNYNTGATSFDKRITHIIPDAQVVEEPPVAYETVPTAPARPSFEEAIPEWLRTGYLMVAWNKLQQEGILDDEYRLVQGVSKAAAKHLVECFCSHKGKNTWRPFEDFWELKDLRWCDSTFSKEQEMTINKIFMNL